jgi:molybdenum cofactor sulfurtransferase
MKHVPNSLRTQCCATDMPVLLPRLVLLCMQAVEQHTQALSSWLFDQLSALRHSNGAPLIQLYGRHGLQGSVTQQGSAEAAAAGFSQGAVFNFQVLQPDGQPVSFSKVDRDATAAGLYLRSGCVCNPGACYDSLGLEAAEVQQLAGLKEGCGDEMDFITVPRPARESAAAAPAADSSSSRAGLWWRWRGASSSSGASGSGSGSAQQQEVGSGGGSSPQEGDLVPTQVPLGSVRASLGWASTFEDVYALVQFLRGYLS